MKPLIPTLVALLTLVACQDDGSRDTVSPAPGGKGGSTPQSRPMGAPSTFPADHDLKKGAPEGPMSMTPNDDATRRGGENVNAYDQRGGTPPSRHPAGTADGAYAPDNSGRNARDRDSSLPTADSQPENEADRDLTQEVRRAIMADESLSINAKNIKIISQNGVVTLRGPVDSVAERQAIGSKVAQLAGVRRVDNLLESVR